MLYVEEVTRSSRTVTRQYEFARRTDGPGDRRSSRLSRTDDTQLDGGLALDVLEEGKSRRRAIRDRSRGEAGDLRPRLLDPFDLHAATAPTGVARRFLGLVARRLGASRQPSDRVCTVHL